MFPSLQELSSFRIFRNKKVKTKQLRSMFQYIVIVSLP